MAEVEESTPDSFRRMKEVRECTPRPPRLWFVFLLHPLLLGLLFLFSKSSRSARPPLLLLGMGPAFFFVRFGVASKECGFCMFPLKLDEGAHRLHCCCIRLQYMLANHSPTLFCFCYFLSAISTPARRSTGGKPLDLLRQPRHRRSEGGLRVARASPAGMIQQSYNIPPSTRFFCLLLYVLHVLASGMAFSWF